MRIGRLIPLLILVGMLLDAGSRFVPLDSFAFRAWEVMVAGKADTGPFAPNATYANPMSRGDLANAGEHAHLRHHHLEYFRTDAWGFRNPPGVGATPGDPPEWVMIGDSFGVGSGVSDEDTLGAQVGRRLGVRVYNASAAFPLRFSDLEATLARLGMREGVVLFEFVERVPMPSIAVADMPREFVGDRPATSGFSDRVASWWESADVSRLSILAGRAFREATEGVSDGDGPNFAVTDHPLSNGDHMLFLNDDVAFSSIPHRRSDPAYLVWLNGALARRGFRLVVVIIPNKYTVYGPLVTTPGAPPAHAEPLDRLEADLRGRGVTVVNTTSRLRAAAAAGLATHELVYFPDDTHWNERGIAIAADMLADAVRAAPRR